MNLEEFAELLSSELNATVKLEQEKFNPNAFTQRFKLIIDGRHRKVFISEDAIYSDLMKDDQLKELIIDTIKEQLKTMKYKFYKKDNRWYIDIPEWEGDIEDLEMVSGADILLEILAKENDSIEVEFSVEPFEDSKCLTFLGDGVYENDAWHGPSTIWLCSVTEFVFGEYPSKIYYK